MALSLEGIKVATARARAGGALFSIETDPLTILEDGLEACVPFAARACSGHVFVDVCLRRSSFSIVCGTESHTAAAKGEERARQQAHVRKPLPAI